MYLWIFFRESLLSHFSNS